MSARQNARAPTWTGPTWARRILWPAQIWPAQIGLSEAQRFLLLALFIGIFSGLARGLLPYRDQLDQLDYSRGLSGPFRFARLLSPALGALAAGFLVLRVFPKAKGSGVNNTKAAIYTSNGYVPSSTIIGKFLACSIAIGTGNSLGPEDPALQMGAGVASRRAGFFNWSAVRCG